ncbi:MAG: hypothetical protein Phyf2KO_23040 [Phycisphaerales bacterium]
MSACLAIGTNAQGVPSLPIAMSRRSVMVVVGAVAEAVIWFPSVRWGETGQILLLIVVLGR